MLRTTRTLALVVTAVGLALLGSPAARAQCYAVPVPVVAAPQVSYYSPVVSYAAPVTSYYYAPAVSYYAPAVSYYAPVSAYSAPAVSYYPARTAYYAAPAGVSTTTYYGLFGRPRETVTRYYP